MGMNPPIPLLSLLLTALLRDWVFHITKQKGILGVLEVSRYLCVLPYTAY